jgi:hypothetical protein
LLLNAYFYTREGNNSKIINTMQEEYAKQWQEFDNISKKWQKKMKELINV